jgi:acyl-CoA synthetase (AMP-forming)/AMP-acid ligase II
MRLGPIAGLLRRDGPRRGAQPTLVDMLRDKAASFGDHVPLKVNGREDLTYAAWIAGSDELARALAHLPKARSAVFALLFDGLDWRDYAVAYAAVIAAGGVVLHLNGRMPEAEIVRRLDECGAAWIIRSAFLTPPRGFEAASLTVADPRPSGAAPARTARRSAPDGRTVAEIRYTSGTTGPAKGYTVPHANLLFNQTLDTIEDLSRARSLLAPIWMADSSSATVLSIAITSVNTLITCLPTDIERMGALIGELGIESVLLTPDVSRHLVASGLEQRYDLRSVRLLAFSSSPLAPALTRKLRAMFPNAAVQVACAQSEASPALVTGSHDETRPFDVGRATPITEVRIVDEDGADAGPGRVGEVWLRTAAAKRLFIAARERNALICSDGWYRTGDLASRAEDGVVTFFDRRDDAISRGERLVSSAHAEAAIMEHPLVREAAVVGFPRDAGGDGLAAFLVLHAPVPPARLAEALGEMLDEDHRPDRILIVPDLPRTGTGKLMKRHLRLLFAGGTL